MVLIAISLSMDAFSLALSVGTIIKNKRKWALISGIVGIFHFFMPLIGASLGHLFMTNLHIQADFLESIIFFYIAIVMFKDFKKEDDENIDLSFFGIFIFAFGVSLDSFGIGFTFSMDLIRILLAVSIFSIISASFTFMGLMFGDKLQKRIGDYSILFGALIMSILAIINFCQLLL